MILYINIILLIITIGYFSTTIFNFFIFWPIYDFIIISFILYICDITENIMKFIVNMTSEYKRVYEISSRYPDIALTLLRQCFSAALFDNSEEVKFRHIYEAIKATKVVYPDVIRKELPVFAETFKDELAAEGIVVEIPSEE